MAKWPKDTPGTWYSHYKRGSLVSGPACGSRVLAEVWTLCAAGSAWFRFCTTEYVYALAPCLLVVMHDSTICTHLQSRWHKEMEERLVDDLTVSKQHIGSILKIENNVQLLSTLPFLCYIRRAYPNSNSVPWHPPDSKHSCIYSLVI